MPKNEKYALGAFEFILLAISEHKRKHDGKPPKSIRVCTATLSDILASPKMGFVMKSTYNEEKRELEFYGTVIIGRPYQHAPSMIDCDNKVVYL